MALGQRKESLVWWGAGRQNIQGEGTWCRKMIREWIMHPQLEPESRKGAHRQAYTFGCKNCVKRQKGKCKQRNKREREGVDQRISSGSGFRWGLISNKFISTWCLSACLPVPLPLFRSWLTSACWWLLSQMAILLMSTYCATLHSRL